MWLAVAYVVGVLLVGVSISGLPCVPCCWRFCWPRGQSLPFNDKSWTVYFPLLGFLLLWWTITPILWLYYSPISTCSPQWMRSAPPDREATSMTQWEGFWCTRLCGESAIAHATSIRDVSTSLVRATSVRVVGSGHSATDVQCPDPGGLVMSIDMLCGYLNLSRAEGLATFSAGCTILETQKRLLAQGYQLIGYGAILSQTVAGALATSLHGAYTNSSFGDNLVGLKAVLANGTVREIAVGDEEIHAWVGSLGELGVIVEVTMRVLPTMRVKCETRRGNQAKAMDALHSKNYAMVVVDTIVGADMGDEPFVIRTCFEAVSVRTGDPIVVGTPPDGSVGMLYETYGLSMLRLASQLPLVRGPMVGGFVLAAPRALHEENAVDETLHSTKGTYNVHPHSELAVPVAYCNDLLDRIRTEAQRAGLAYILAIKVVPASRAWRTWATNRSCTINLDFYDFGQTDSVTRDLQFRAFTEDVAVDEMGGGMHLGKMWVRPNRSELLRNAPRAAEFERLRQILDPTDKLQNDHTRSTHGDGQCTVPLPIELDIRSAVWRGFVWAGVALSTVIAVAVCLTFIWAHCRDNRTRTLPTPKEEDKLPLIGVKAPA